MDSIRKYGSAPFAVAVIHGGPGAPGEVAPVARELSARRGVLEPLQAATSLEGQVDELLSALQTHGDLPVTLIGHSWGAWLSYVFTARYPQLVGRLILVGSAPFEEMYVPAIMETRLNRLNEEERARVHALQKALGDPNEKAKDADLAEFGRLLRKADSFDTLPVEDEDIAYQYDAYQGVWEEAGELRRSGKLLELGGRIECPVVAIHGDYDPHPFEGVKMPLSLVVKDFRFILLKNCGHYPWIERRAKDTFYEILEVNLP